MLHFLFKLIFYIFPLHILGLHCSLKGTNSDEEIAPAETLVNVEMDGSMSVVVEGTEDQSALNASEIIENFFNPPQNPSLPKKKKTVIRRAYKKRQVSLENLRLIMFFISKV